MVLNYIPISIPVLILGAPVAVFCFLDDPDVVAFVLIPNDNCSFTDGYISKGYTHNKLSDSVTLSFSLSQSH